MPGGSNIITGICRNVCMNISRPVNGIMCVLIFKKFSLLTSHNEGLTLSMAYK